MIAWLRCTFFGRPACRVVPGSAEGPLFDRALARPEPRSWRRRAVAATAEG